VAIHKGKLKPNEMYTLHHCPLNEGIENNHVFANMTELMLWIEDYLESHFFDGQKVYLYTTQSEEDENNEITVTERKLVLHDAFIEDYTSHESIRPKDYFLQEYPSFQAAYEVALAMKETSKLCYSEN
jgi:hypothetical protein